MLISTLVRSQPKIYVVQTAQILQDPVQSTSNQAIWLEGNYDSTSPNTPYDCPVVNLTLLRLSNFSISEPRLDPSSLSSSSPAIRVCSRVPSRVPRFDKEPVVYSFPSSKPNLDLIQTLSFIRSQSR